MTWERVELENEQLRVVVVPARGGEVRELWHRPTATQVLWHAPWPLPPGPEIPRGARFDDWYAGGWQDLLPNGDDACTLDGVAHDFHGESWARRWAASRDGDALVLSVALETVPLAATRRLRLRGSTLVVDERVENVGAGVVRFAWGHHPAFGGNLLEEGCELDLPGGTTEGYAVDLGAASRLEPGARATWPYARGRDGSLVDLRPVPARDARVHDVALVTDLADGWFALRNPARDVGVAVRFPRRVFPWLWLWRAFGGAEPAPFDERTYTLAVEPWTSPPCLARAAERGAEARLRPGQALEARLEVTLFSGARRRLRAVEPRGIITFPDTREE